MSEGNPAGLTVVAGLGEVGAPLLELVRRSGQEVVGVDVDTPKLPDPGATGVLHVCFPFEIPDFIAETVRYIDVLRPQLTVINSTVAVGTTRAIAERAGAPVVHSPVRGKHVRMLEELCSYVKLVGPIDDAAGVAAVAHFTALGMTSRSLSSPEATELAKLTETTYFGLLIAWAQEVERYCDQVGADYDEVVSIYEEIAFLPRTPYFPGVIGGHCVMPNIEILSRLDDSALLDAIRSSNELKKARTAAAPIV